MDKRDIEYYWMCKRIQARGALPANVIIINAYKPIKDDFILFNTHIGQIEALMPDALVIGTGWTSNQDVAKRACTLFWANNVCKTFKGFAKKFGKNDFLNAVNFTQSKLNAIKLPVYYRTIVQLNTVGALILADTDYIAGLYNVDAPVLTAGMVKANTFLSCTGQAKEIENDNKETNVEIKAMIQTLRGDLSIMDEDIFGVSSTTLINQYFTDRKLVISSIIHNKVLFTGIDAVTSLGIENIFIINQGAKKGDYCNIDGKVELHKKPGTNILLLSHINPLTGLPDYEPQTVRVTAIFKGSVNLNVKMIPIITERTATENAEAKKPSKKSKKPQTFAATETPKPVAKEQIPPAKATSPKKAIVNKTTEKKK